MDYKDELLSLREDIDTVDAELVELFKQRMLISEKIAGVKSAGNISIVDEKREQDVMEKAMASGSEDGKSEILAFMRNLIALSKLKQNKNLNLSNAISFPESSKTKTENITVAFQGVAGAWGEHAAEQLFPDVTTYNYDYFEDVFKAVKSGKTDYGVLPIENSQTGAIGEVYNLLKRYNCYIVGQVWITVAQCLIAYKDAKISDIREVYSHPEGFGQCRRFLQKMNWELTACRNTAYAAKLVAEKNSNKFASIGSRKAAEVYGLSVIAPDIMDNQQNKTRFIAISKKPIYDSSCDTTSITFSTAHKSGALCAVLQSLMLAGINLSRIESRPVSADKYRFFADLQANILSDITIDALKQASAHSDYFEVLGCYNSIVKNENFLKGSSK